MLVAIERFVVVDSSLVLDLLGALPTSPIRGKWKEWERTRVSFAAPSLIGFEITNALLKQQRLNLWSSNTVDMRLSRFLEIPLTLFDHRRVAVRSLELARFYGLGKTDDMSFVALAELLDCELWTTDFSLFRTVHHHHPNVHALEPV